MNKILIVDDDPSILNVLQLRLETCGHDAATADSAEQALNQARNTMFDLVLLDHKLGDTDGIELMEQLRQQSPHIQVIIMTAYGTISKAVEAVQKGAWTYLTKPFDGDSDLMEQVEKCLQKNRLTRQTSHMRTMVKQALGVDNIICKSENMLNVLKQVKQAAATDSTILISGESGTGKELIARSVHQASSRCDHPFMAVNCAALPETLFESEMFGCEKGAFTGANKSRDGYLAQAGQGTFFFDEISEIPSPMQAKLLRVLQENEFHPLGSASTVQLDARIIAATNKDLAEEVAQERFRQDLYYRIHVIPIHIPPLRERPACIPYLADHFLTTYARSMEKEVSRLSNPAMNKLLQYHWPGNIRELKNVIEYAVAMSSTREIPDKLVLPKTGKQPTQSGIRPLKQAKSDFEMDYIIEMLKVTKGNVSQAASLSGKYRADFYGLMKKYRLNADDFRI